MTDTTRDYRWAAELREAGFTWKYIASEAGFPSANAARKSIKRYLNRQKISGEGNFPETEYRVLEPGDVETSEFGTQEGRIVQKWVKQEDGSTVHIKMPDAVEEMSEARQAFEDYKADVLDHSPDYDALVRTIDHGIPSLGGDPEGGCMFELAIHDPHFGMLAWHREVGGISQDLATITQDYTDAVESLLPLARLYNTKEIVYIVGHDLTHVNQYGLNNSGGTTARGTAQDVDGRIAKIFTAARRSVVGGIDRARQIKPVKVIVVPGNHDPDESYKMGEVINAWFRNDPEVTVQYSANKRQFHSFGANTFMYTHGEEYRRKRDNLPMIMADECPPEMWVSSHGGCREIHTGHNHINLAGGYYPTIYRASGGIAGLHEFNL
jgi:hypothetical protein